ncbi:hypothetical protein SPBRAN_1517 [uncultured Candidatus Thioglobus sp.]|nr:hypothetical protein SPBRAN_1517 [uncultured Candidatus Thioglobus sp.]
MSNNKGVIFAYDEAQNLADNAAKDEYPLSVVVGYISIITTRWTATIVSVNWLTHFIPQTG